MHEKLKFIKQLDFFNSLNNEELEIISEISTISKHTKESILYYENDTYDKLFFLVSGLLKVYKVDKYNNEIFLYHIYENSLVSELSVIDRAAIHCFSNTQFLEDSIVLEVDFFEFKKRFLSQNILNSEFINEILLKTHQLHCVVNRELVFDATSKVAYMLCDDLAMFNKLKRQEVSFMLHIQPETLSRVLKKLKRAEIIDVDHSQIIIKDIKALKNIYKGE
ncbi:MAG: CRP-like cAMP-binding protein [Sulfurimonas sp.]|jgi:CRP-like cAMP-binding protein|uniref:Crp/Fnr family transcriptional regulator n=1 Tax=Sulfurimonas sp. TaxID=2022749 RepID=UPI0039E481C0